jgi:hypothetical protein
MRKDQPRTAVSLDNGVVTPPVSSPMTPPDWTTLRTVATLATCVSIGRPDVSSALT